MIRNVAIMGATGAVGQEILSILEERNFPLQSLKLLASERSAGKEFKFKGETLKCEVLNKDSFKGIDLVLSSAGAAISQEFAPIAVENGAVVVDNTSFFRMDPTVPLVVPEVNPEDIKLYKAELGGKGIIANPNCTTIMMVVVLNPIEKISHIKKIHISSYQSASGAGAVAMEELKQQYKDILETGSTTHINKFPFQLAYLPLGVGGVRGPYWTRTSDPIDVNDVLYQLSQRTNLVRFPTIFYILGQNFGCAPGNACTTD